MLCLCKLSEAHGRLPVPFCVAACGYDYHVWHELFMNRLPLPGAPRRMPMRRNKILKIVPIIMLILGGLFILRGLELGIPYISPKKEALKVEKKMNSEKTSDENCH